MVTCQQLYQLVPESRSFDLRYLAGAYFNHAPELDHFAFLNENAGVNERVEVRVLRRADFDSRRYWQLATVWLDDRPIMVIQNAGREGDDYYDRFITDGEAYREMIGYIGSLHAFPETVDLLEERADLTRFYGETMETAPLTAERARVERLPRPPV